MACGPSRKKGVVTAWSSNPKIVAALEEALMGRHEALGRVVRSYVYAATRNKGYSSDVLESAWADSLIAILGALNRKPLPLEVAPQVSTIIRRQTWKAVELEARSRRLRDGTDDVDVEALPAPYVAPDDSEDERMEAVREALLRLETRNHRYYVALMASLKDRSSEYVVDELERAGYGRVSRDTANQIASRARAAIRADLQETRE
jgi:DNA-directed RNA polymerase specialized sigma24 family protein